MPGNTWKDLGNNNLGNSNLRKNSNKRTTTQPNVDARNKSNESNQPSLNQRQKQKALERAKKVSPRLAGLLEQREGLESRMRNLSGGSQTEISPSDAVRFQVASFAERQAQQRIWESRREQLRTQAADIRNQSRNSSSVSRSASRSSGSPQGSVNQWLARRDAQRQNLREGARDRLSPLNDVAQVGRRLGGSLSSASQQLRNLDRQLADQGLSQESEELRSLGGGRLNQTQSTVSKYTKMAEAPLRAVNKIDNFWKKRQQEISGPMDKASSYVDRNRRRLSTRTGGSGDLFERMERNRDRALQRRKEKQREEARDEARRKRAQQSKRQATKEKMSS